MKSMLKDIGSSDDDVAANFIIFCFSMGLIFFVILLIVCLRKRLYGKMPKFLQNLVIKIGNMLMYNSVLRYLLTAYMSLLMGALVIIKMPSESTSGYTIAMSSF